MRRYLRPRWLVVHVLFVLVVAVLVSLGFWQLQRLEERRARNELFVTAAARPARPIDELIDVDDPEGPVDDLRFRTVTATGTFDGGDTISVRTTQDGASGGWVFTTMDVGGGEVVAVLRGFAPLDDEGSVLAPAAPSGERTVEGTAIPVARLPRTARTAVERLAADEPGLLALVVQATQADEPLTPVPPPDLDDEGPHLAYAVQWFLFATIAAVGYPILLRRRAGD